MRRLSFFLPVILLGILAPLLAMYWVEPAYGDLARIGFLPERHFGWQVEQPSLVRRTSTALQSDAEVLVVGDSFSGMGYWQEAAMGRATKFVTYGFGRICADFSTLLLDKGLRPKIIVIETVERYFDERFFQPCEHSRLEDAAENGSLPESETRDRSIWGGLFGVKYVIGSMAYLLHGGAQHRPGHSGGVSVAEVTEGCRQFSNRDCGLSLFLGDDRLLPGLPKDKLMSPVFNYVRDAGINRIIVVPIPNKTSVYLQSAVEAEEKDAYLTRFAEHNNATVLPFHRRFWEDRFRHIDFYYPDDTHLSPRGLLVLGAYIKEHLNND